MPFSILPLLLAGLFLLVLCYVAWMKIYEHLLAHRREHDERSHHLVAVRKIRKRKGARNPQVVESQPVRS